MKMVYIYFAVISALILYSCGAFYQEPKEEKQDLFQQSTVSTIVRDTIYIGNDEGGVIAGERNLAEKQVTFNQIGQEYKIKQGEVIRLVLNNIDTDKSTFDMITDDATGEVTLKLIDKNDHRVILTQKCETVTRYNADFIPRVEFDGKLVEQVVTTPIMNDECEVIGFQIRFGARERGCRDESTNQIYKKFIDCTKNKKQKDNGISLSQECKKRIKLGLPCK